MKGKPMCVRVAPTSQTELYFTSQSAFVHPVERAAAKLIHFLLKTHRQIPSRKDNLEAGIGYF